MTTTSWALSLAHGVVVGILEVRQSPPSNPVPNAHITREAKIADQRLALGFKWSVPDCLASIALQNT
ncbi:hypothetical protein ACNQFN_11145 [Thauera butanivorans]|uniref:hypothetical protein n=1 Tax=Thauera butanivorans TaxID=86174 RepID=UPI003AB347BB